MAYRVILLNSADLSGGEAKAPSASSLQYGEIAVNYNAGNESIFLKNSNNEVVKISKSDILKEINDYYDGYSSQTGIANIPTSKRLVFCTISSTSSLSLANTLASSGHNELHIMIHNTSTSDVNVALPDSGTYVNLGDSTKTISGSGYLEVNIITDGTNDYIRTI